MSWIEKVQKDLTITTGDGKVYTPNYLNAKFEVEFNVAVLDFINVSGSFVDRRQPKAKKYALELYFQGEDHLDNVANFSTSSEDNRFWTLSHPFYGEIKVQPASLSFSNNIPNLTIVTGTVIETIEDLNPKGTVIANDVIEQGVFNTNLLSVQNTKENILIDSSDVSQQVNDVNQLFKTVKPGIITNANGEEFLKLKNATIALITGNPNDSLFKVQEFLIAPALFGISLAERLVLLRTNYNTFKSETKKSIANPLTIVKNILVNYENFASALIGALCLSTTNVNEETDYSNKNQILDYVSLISATYKDYLVELDSYQTGTGGGLEDYVPNAASMTALNSLVNFTLSNLFQNAFEAKQERVHIINYRTNIILLTHLLYGLDPDDIHMNELIDQNDIGLNELLEIKKDRKIIYYV